MSENENETEKKEPFNWWFWAFVSACVVIVLLVLSRNQPQISFGYVIAGFGFYGLIIAYDYYKTKFRNFSIHDVAKQIQREESKVGVIVNILRGNYRGRQVGGKWYVHFLRERKTYEVALTSQGASIRGITDSPIYELISEDNRFAVARESAKRPIEIIKP